MIIKRLCTKDDSTLISKMCNEIWHECYEDMLSYEQRLYMLDSFLSPSSIKKTLDNGYNFYLVYLKNELSAFFAYKKYDDHLYLDKLYSYKKYRGNGLLKYVLDYLNTYKLDIKLRTCKNNPTLAIYKHVGFTVYSEAKVDIGSGFYMDDYNMIKKYE